MVGTSLPITADVANGRDSTSCVNWQKKGTVIVLPGKP
jgi:hypothetical protein